LLSASLITVGMTGASPSFPVWTPVHSRHGGRPYPVHQRLGPWVSDAVAHQPLHRHFSPPDGDGWSKVLPCQAKRPPGPRTAASRLDPAPRRCLNCLSYSHCQATGTRPTRCLCCFKLHHIARDCKRLRTPPIGSTAIGAVRLPRREVRHYSEAPSTVMSRVSDAVGSTPREVVTSRGASLSGQRLPASESLCTTTVTVGCRRGMLPVAEGQNRGWGL
jgi:hypothetical protein